MTRLHIDHSLTFRVVLLTVLAFISVVALPAQLVFPEEERICPRGKWFHNETSKCFKENVQGPCPPSLLFYRFDKVYGDCDCPTSKQQFANSTVWIYDVSSEKCYRTFDQAYCEPGKWLMVGLNGSFSCQPNICEAYQDPEAKHPVVMYKGSCVHLGEPNSDKDCPSPYEITIDQHSGIPLCTSSLNLSNFDIGVKRKLTCRPGTRRDRLGKCRQFHQIADETDLDSE